MPLRSRLMRGANGPEPELTQKMVRYLIKTRPAFKDSTFEVEALSLVKEHRPKWAILGINKPKDRSLPAGYCTKHNQLCRRISSKVDRIWKRVDKRLYKHLDAPNPYNRSANNIEDGTDLGHLRDRYLMLYKVWQNIDAWTVDVNYQAAESFKDGWGCLACKLGTLLGDLTSVKAVILSLALPEPEPHHFDWMLYKEMRIALRGYCEVFTENKENKVDASKEIRTLEALVKEMGLEPADNTLLPERIRLLTNLFTGAYEKVLEKRSQK